MSNINFLRLKRNCNEFAEIKEPFTVLMLTWTLLVALLSFDGLNFL